MLVGIIRPSGPTMSIFDQGVCEFKLITEYDDDHHIFIWWSSYCQMMIIISTYDDHHIVIYWSSYSHLMILISSWSGRHLSIFDQDVWCELKRQGYEEVENRLEHLKSLNDDSENDCENDNCENDSIMLPLSTNFMVDTWVRITQYLSS